MTVRERLIFKIILPYYIYNYKDNFFNKGGKITMLKIGIYLVQISFEGIGFA